MRCVSVVHCIPVTSVYMHDVGVRYGCVMDTYYAIVMQSLCICYVWLVCTVDGVMHIVYAGIASVHGQRVTLQPRSQQVCFCLSPWKQWLKQCQKVAPSTCQGHVGISTASIVTTRTRRPLSARTHAFTLNMGSCAGTRTASSSTRTTRSIGQREMLKCSAVKPG